MSERFWTVSPRLRRMAGNEQATQWAVYDGSRVIYESRTKADAEELKNRLNEINERAT